MAMEVLLVLFLSITTLIVIIFFNLMRSNGKNAKRETLKLPQGSMGWPLIGETFSFMQPHSSASLGEFMDQHITKYGKIFKTRLLGKPTIVSADPELNRVILQNEGRLFENSCPMGMAAIAGQWSMLVLAGDVHKEMRSIAVEFMSISRLKTIFLHDIEKEAVKILHSWAEKSLLSAHEEGKKFSFNLMVKHLMNMDPEMPESKQLMSEYVTFMGGMASLPFNFPGTAYRKALQSRSKILKIIGKKLDESTEKIREGREEMNEVSLLSSVIKHSNLSREQIFDLVLGMLFAGHETTSAAIALAIYFLESCPEALQQLQGEHEEIASLKEEQGEIALNWTDYKQMEFTHCVINETLRLGNIVKFLHRRAIKDVQFKGYDIPCGWEVVPILSAANLDPSVFDDPQTFNPWRWQNLSSAITKGSSTMSFGGGPRLCPGAELSKIEIAFFLHHLVRNYQWQVLEHDHPISFPFLGFLKGLPIKICPLEKLN